MRSDRLIAWLLALFVLVCAPLAAHSQTSEAAPAATQPAAAQPAGTENTGTQNTGTGTTENGATSAPASAPESAPPTAKSSAAEQPAATPAVLETSSTAAVTTAEQKLSAAEDKIASLVEKVNENKENDTALVGLKLETETLARSMLDIGVSLRPRQTEIKARLDQLGAPPAEGELPESDAVTEERNRLAEERSTINALTGRAETVSVRANEIGDQISSLRRDLFATTLFKRTELGPDTISEVTVAFDAELKQFERIYGSWLRFIVSFKWQSFLVWLFLSLLAALIFVPGAYRLFGGLIKREPFDENPPYTSRLSVAFWSTLIPSVAMALLAGTVYMLFDSLSLLRLDVAPVISTGLIVLVGIYFVAKLARAVLAPRVPAWRLVDISDSGARVLFFMVVALAVVNGLDYLLTTLSQTLNSPVVLTVAKGIVAVVIMALILLAMSAVKPMLAVSGNPSDPGGRWPKFIFVTLLVAGVGLLLTILLGYVGLARFVATQIVVTGAILTTMYIGYLSGKAVSEPEAFAHTAVGRWLQARYGLGPVALDQSGLAAGLMINVLVLMLGVPLILLQWGFHIQDIELWFYRLMTDIRIGGITISLVGILIGVVFFGFGLIATRWFQRWLDGSVMARGRLDTGVRNSIKTGVGYLGVAVAGLVGVSAAGINLSSLALVAGALSLGIGFGLQNIVSNFVSGLILLVERPFKVGDWVVTSSTEGFVKKISVRATEIETFTKQSIIVPNSELINSPVGNWTHRNKLGRVDVAVGVSYDADPRRLIEILTEIAGGHDLVLKNPEPVVHFAGFGDSSLDFVLKCHVADVLNGITVKTELSLQVFERLKAENIEIPFPQRDLNIKIGEDNEVLTVLSEKILGGPDARIAAAKKAASAKASSQKSAAEEAAVEESGQTSDAPAKKPRRRRVSKRSEVDSIGEGLGHDSEGGDR